MCSAKTAELIEMPLGGATWLGLKNHVLDGGQHPPTGMCNFFGFVQLIEKHCESLLRCMQQKNL